MAIKNCTDPKSPAAGYYGAGPDDANHLFVIDGQFDASLTVGSQGTNFAVTKETFSVLVGPKLTNRQFVRAIATTFDCKDSNG